jgi:hypothetical protein
MDWGAYVVGSIMSLGSFAVMLRWRRNQTVQNVGFVIGMLGAVIVVFA